MARPIKAVTAGKAALLAMLLLGSAGLLAQDAAPPSCAGPPQPSYAASGEQPRVQVWGKNSRAVWPLPLPLCTGWPDRASTLLVALAGTFSYAGKADQLLQRFGAISSLRGIQYWSVSDQAWQVLVTDAAALDGPRSADRRADFAPPEMKAGQRLYFAQHDSRSSGEIVYQLRVREAGADRLVLELENVSPIRTFFVTVFSPGDMKFLYFLDRRSGNNWGFYALLSANSAYAEGKEASYINRAAAFYRHFTGVPTAGAPPLAP